MGIFTKYGDKQQLIERIILRITMVYGYSPFFRIKTKKARTYILAFLFFSLFSYSSRKETDTFETISISPMANVSFSGICSYATSTDFIEA